MRLRVSLLIGSYILAAWMPLLAIAASGASGANLAPGVPTTPNPGSAGACILKLFQQQNQKKAAAGSPAGATTDGLKDNCTSETVTVDASGKKTITQTGRLGDNNACVADSCSASACANVTITIAGSASKVVSKCSDQYKQLSAGGLASGVSGLVTQTIAQQAIANIQPGTDSGNAQLAQALQQISPNNLTAAQAQAAVAQDPQAALDLLQQAASGNTNSAQIQSDEAALNLNDAVKNDITNLQPSQLPGVVAGAATPGQQSLMNNVETNSPSTFAQPAASTGPAANISGTLAPLCNQLGGCGTSCNGSYVCATNNPGALTWASWESKYGGQPCGQPNNATCFPNMESGIAAQANLLTTSSRYFASGNGTIQSAFCGGYSDNCTAYSTFISNQTGIPLNQTIDPNNAQQVGAIMMASSRFESGTGVIYTPDQLQTGLQSAYGGTIPAGTSGYTPSTIYSTPGVGSPVGSIFSGTSVTSVPGQAMTSSPFANVSPIYSTPGLGSGYAQPVPTIPAAVASVPQTPNYYPTQPNTTAPVSAPAGAAVVSTGQSGAAVAQIIAQPQSVSAGGQISVSWSSVGMSAVSPCQVLENAATPVGNANEGAQVVIATSTGTLVFSLSCTAQGGGAVQSSASVVVQ